MKYFQVDGKKNIFVEKKTLSNQVWQFLTKLRSKSLFSIKCLHDLYHVLLFMPANTFFFVHKLLHKYRKTLCVHVHSSFQYMWTYFEILITRGQALDLQSRLLRNTLYVRRGFKIRNTWGDKILNLVFIPSNFFFQNCLKPVVEIQPF